MNSTESLTAELDELSILLDQGRATEAQARLSSLIAANKLGGSLLARGRSLLSMALEMQGRYRESLEAVSMYESPESLARLDVETKAALRAQVGLAYNYTGDHPKAIALLNAALKDITENGSDGPAGKICLALARVYRSISENPIARDYAQRALEHFRVTGEWHGLAEAYFGIALAEVFEGSYESALSHFEQALQLIGDKSATYLQGKIHTNMAGTCWFLKRPQDGIRYLEKAISYYEHTEHKANATDGYNNLGINLILLGDWNRAQGAFERALAIAAEIDEDGPQVPMVLDSLGELLMLRGSLEEARGYLERAVKTSNHQGNKWYVWQPLRTLGRCHLMMGDAATALNYGQQALQVGEHIGDRQAICESRLLLSDAYLHLNLIDQCAIELADVASRTADSSADLAVVGELERLQGHLAIAQSDHAKATQHFGRCVSIFEMLGDRYHGALAHYGLGCAYAKRQPEKAEEHLRSAIRTFEQLGAELDLAKSESALAALDRQLAPQQSVTAELTQLLTTRLIEAATSRELILRELAAVVFEETNARRVMMIDSDESHAPRIVVAHGYLDLEIANLTNAAFRAHLSGESDGQLQNQGATVIRLRPNNAPAATLIAGSPQRPKLQGGMPIDSLLKVVELCLEVTTVREASREGQGERYRKSPLEGNLIPGFIYSSPAMTKIIEKIQKIRSSDVTVLITGESGTGKELVARAVHMLSSRRSNVFLPFNCTAVPKELSEGYLFGYKRGSYTGALSDSPGVVRTAAGGTLFLDEIGDLPLDVQPKLLRFLQEGEVQPLGEQRPIKVDVRILAATNTELEEMVAGGRFREDLYYRLNVIRLQVPPLRERRSEIPDIVNYYIHHYSKKFGHRDIQISPQAIDLLMVNDWPGNVRQLCNEIQRMVASAEDGALITADQLSPELKRTSAPLVPVTASQSMLGRSEETFGSLADAVASLEQRMISDALQKHAGNITRASRELGMTRRGLQLKLGRYRDSEASE